MSPAKRVLSGVVIGLWAGLALGADTSVPEPITAADSATMGQWERKGTVHSEPNKPAQLARDVGVDKELKWGPVRQVSAMAPVETPIPEIRPIADPKPNAGPKRTVAPQAASEGLPPIPATTPAEMTPRGMMVSPEAVYGDGEVGFGGPPCAGGPGGPACGRAFDVYGANEGCDRCGGDCRSLPTLSIWGGVHGFKGPTDFGRNGNFGFQEGANWSSSLGNLCPSLCGFSYQVGMNATQSNFTGDQTVGRLHEGERDQVFFTAGVFHRAVCHGLQWGVVYDYLRDGYLENFELQQVRGEMSLVRQTGGEFGFWGAWGLDNDRWQGLTVETNDVYAFFYRKTFGNGGTGRLWAGFTDHKDELLGADIYIPLGESFALTNSFQYLIPAEGSQNGGSIHETWSVAMNLVWYFGRNPCVHQSPNRPLMPVADNSYFLINTRPGTVQQTQHTDQN